MDTDMIRSGERKTSAADRALHRIVAEILDGLRHGYFEFRVTCEVIGHGRRRLTLHAGKSHQFVIPSDECEQTDRSNNPHDRSVVDSCASRSIDNNTFIGSQGKPNDS